MNAHMFFPTNVLNIRKEDMLNRHALRYVSGEITVHMCAYTYITNYSTCMYLCLTIYHATTRCKGPCIMMLTVLQSHRASVHTYTHVGQIQIMYVYVYSGLAYPIPYKRCVCIHWMAQEGCDHTHVR